VYRSTDGRLKPLPDPAVHPADLARTTTTQGVTVNYIVRVETGTINRAIYQIAVLHDPAAGPVPDPWRTSPAWNGRLLYSYGGGAKAGYHQGRTTGGVLQTASGGDVLALGYAMAASSLNVFGNNAGDVLSAETTMMVKEHFVERYGVPVYTLGTGSSGGSMQLHLINQNYPGMMEGFAARNSFARSPTARSWRTRSTPRRCRGRSTRRPRCPAGAPGSTASTTGPGTQDTSPEGPSPTAQAAILRSRPRCSMTR
jgi:hypothetical protein